MKLRFLLAMIIFSSFLSAQEGIQRNHAHSHDVAPDSRAYIAMLDNPERDAYQRPEEVLDALRLQAGEIIADIGAGSGYFAFRLAKRVAPRGRVFAVDINPDMIRHMNRRIRDTGPDNVVTLLADPEDPLLPHNRIDRVFICNTWHHIQKQTQYLSLLKEALRPGGQVIMIDYKKKELPVGPPVSMKIDRETLIDQMETAGFHLFEEHSFLPYQYFLVFTPDPS